MTTSDNGFLAKNGNLFHCELCDYSTCKKYNIMVHYNSKKHKMNKLTTIDNELMAKNGKYTNYVCTMCEKSFNDRAGLWRHNKKCQITKDTTIESQLDDKDIIMLLINENKEFRNLLLEQCKHNTELVKETTDMKSMMMKVIENGTHNTNTTNNNTTTNSHNKAFNLQFFLNETCKDAMNITDFLDSIQLQLSDLENMEEIGFVQGISNIIIKNLNALDVTKRPLHCTDKKRETIYIKDQGVWEKDVENIKIRGFVKKVAGKNARLLQVFKEKHPDYNQYHSKYSTQYNKLIIEAFGGKGDNDLEKEDKIIRNITKTILVEK